MIPRLYESTETAFTTFGICSLSDCISCMVTEERNGQYTLEIQYPRSGLWFSEIKVDRLILVQAHDGDEQTQPFRIERIEGSIGEVVTIYAVHISYQLNWIVTDGDISTHYGRNAQDAMRAVKENNLASPCPFTFYSDITTTKDYEVSDVTTFRSLLGGIDGSILDVYGGEYEWDRYDVHLWENRGQDNGVRIMYGKNLTYIDWETDVSETYTSVLAFWEQEQEDGTLTRVTGYPQSIYPNNPFAFERTIIVDTSSEFEGAPTENQLNTYASNYVKANAKTPTISFTIQFVPLWQTNEYKDYKDFEKVELCDTVHIIYPPLGIELDAQVVKTVYNVLLDRYDSIEVSTTKKNLATTVFAMQKEIKRYSIKGGNRRLTR